MTMYVDQNLRSVNGRTLIIPSWKGGQEGWTNLDFPDIRDVDTLQKWPVGTKLIDGERVYYYCRSAVIVDNVDTGIVNYYPQSVAYTTVAVAASAGDTSLTLDVAATDGRAKDGVIAVNSLAGGYLVIFGHDDDATCHRIVSNTAVATGEMTVVLQDEINAALVVDADHCECMESFFNNTADAHTYGTGTTPFVGIAQAKTTVAGQYHWVQTWGPCWIPPQANICNEAHDLDCIWRYDGSIQEMPANDGTLANGFHMQRAGFVMAGATDGTATQGAPFVMLQICP